MKVGFIGLGTMGASMALNTRAKGYDMIVHDLRRDAAGPHLDKGAVWANSARQVAEAADVVFTSLPGPKEVQAVAEELIAGMRKGTAWFDLSTNSPTVVRQLSERFAAKGIAMLDAPVSGGPSGAKSGKLAIWVSGEKSAFDKHKAVLDAIGDQAIYIGPVGAGTIAKLVHNCAGYAVLAALAEVMTMGVKAGVEPLALWAAIRQGAFGRRRSFDRLAEQFLVGKFDPPAFALELAHKDVTLATEVGREFHVPMKIANTVLQEMTEAMNREGWAKRDSRIFMLLQEERAGVNIKVPAAAVQEVLDRG
ncbi:MAG: 3-hydroxyisobutyrate dehydrogenase [Betaproteobacteria bacterium RIFCSPLOWO2_02_FULL_67_26]|nr:MAG: 3-hydroxyisobutyrate dehydrogenase [Betaproteobacteria bacterium RIFCSPLOWO2_02_FULL_67_26]